MQMKTPHVRVRPLLERLLFILILPVALAFLADAALDTSPFIVIVVALVCIPLTTVLVLNSALQDMNALIAVVAPPIAEEAAEAETTAEDVAEAEAAHDEF